MYNIYKGYIKNYDTLRSKDGITTYSIEMASNKSGSFKNKNFYNIAHGYNGSPENSDGLYDKGTLVYFVADEVGDGFIIGAVDKNPGIKNRILKQDEELKDTFDNSGSIPITPGDYIVKKLDGFIALLYSGLVWLRAKLGTEIILNPILESVEIKGSRIRITAGQNGIAEFGLSKEEGKSNFNFMVASDTTGEDPNGTIVHLKAGQHGDDKKLSLNVFKNLETVDPELLELSLSVDGSMSIFCKKDKLTLNISPDGDITLSAKSLNFNVNNNAQVEIKEDGKMYVKSEEYYLGKGTTDQPFVRGTALQTNYDDLMDLLADHEHIVVNGRAIRSFDLIELVDKKLQEGVELSTTKKLD